MLKVAYVGFMTDVHPDWRAFCPPPVPPANYKDLDKIQAWTDKATEKQTSEAKDKPLTGKISEFYLFERPYFNASDDDDERDTLIDRGSMDWPNCTALEILSDYDRIFVLNAGVFAVLARMEHVDARGQLSNDNNWIVTSRLTHFSLLSFNPKDVPKLFDPIDLLVSSTAEENCDPYKVLLRLVGKGDLPGFLSLGQPDAQLPYMHGRTAAERALIALEIARRLGA